MATPGSINELLIGAAGAAGAGYEISRSLRFNSSDSAYLSKNFASDGNRKTWTAALWMKRSFDASFYQSFLINRDAASYNLRINDPTDQKFYLAFASGVNLSPAPVYRDYSAWMHVVVVYDSSNATSTDRLRLYVNGERVTAFDSANYPTLNQDSEFNKAGNFGIGHFNAGTAFDGYLADYHFIDGQALDPSSFGEFDTNNVWQPKAYTGSYGTNGFHLPFSDNSTAAALGTDSSGNGNDWTVNNIVAVTPSVVNPNRPTWTTADAGWTLSNSNYKAFYGGASAYNQVFSLLDSNTVYRFALDAVYGSTYAGWFFSDSTTVNNTVPDELQNNTMGLRHGESGVGAYGNFASANSVSSGQDAIPGFSSVSVTPTQRYSSWVIDMVNRKVWIQAPGSPTWIGGGDPSNTSSTPSLYLPSGTVYFGYVGYDPGTSAEFSLVAGDPASVDSLVDSPTNYGTDTGAGGEVRGNYATWNPLFGENQSLSNGNLKAESSATGYAIIASTIAMKSGKWYMEYTYTPNNDQPFITWGISQTNRDGTAGSGVSDTAEDKGFKAWDSGFYSQSAGQNVYDYSSSVSSGDIISLAFDADAGKLWVAKNGTWMTNASGTGNPATGANPDYSSLTYSGGYYFMAGPYYTNGSTLEANFGARAFAYTAPSGYKCLNTANLSDPTIADGSTAMDVVLDTGANILSAAQGAIGGSADLLWIKDRANVNNHQLIDTVRGGTLTLQSNTTAAETTYVAPTGSSVAWTWDAGSSTVTNTDGSISAQVRANPSAGFSIVSYTGDGAASATIGHGLNAAPEFIMVKNRDVTDEGSVYHVGTDATSPQNYFLKLFSTTNGTDASSDVGAMWNDTAPTSSVFSVGTEDNVNASTEDYIAYCFSPVESYSAMGSYVGNGSNDGSFVYTGFAVKWLLTKASSAITDWQMWDVSRQPYNVNANTLTPNSSAAESGGAGYAVDLLSNGFKFRLYGSSSNASGVTYVWAAFASHPFKTSRAR